MASVNLAMLCCSLGWENISLQAENTDFATQICENNAVIVEIKPYAQFEIEYVGCQVEQLTEQLYCISGEKDALLTVAKDLSKQSQVADVQPDFTYHMLEEANALVNDASYEKQWGLHNDGTSTYTNSETEPKIAVPGVDVQAEEAWSQFRSEDSVVVAVIDTGIDYKHEDLKDSIWINEDEIAGNGKDDDGNGFVDDRYGWDFFNGDNSICSYEDNGKAKAADNDNHGTHCAGTIAATANNGVGIAGVASNVNVKIMAVKALGGANGATSTSKLVKAIRYAVNNGADIINASWGGWLSEQDNALKKVIAQSGCLFVAAAGNAGADNDKIACYPANYNKSLTNVISIGSVDCDGTLSYFSNYGKSVDILAPGSNIYGTIVGGYGRMSGTSMAVPFVSGIAAMLYADKDGLYPENVREVLLQSYQPLSGVREEKVARSGIISAKLAVENRGLLKTDLEVPSFTTLYADYDGVIHVEGTDAGESGICTILYAKGKKAAKYFRKGMKGKSINGKEVTVKDSGDYTFYIKDYAGNETISRLNVTVDTKPPIVRAVRVNTKIKLIVKDEQTEVVQIRYAYGQQKKSYFVSGNGKTMKVKKDGTKILKRKKGYLSIYVVDRVGNVTYKIFKF